jgi:hypothetical protein
MNRRRTFSYDKEADALYISFSPVEKATAAVELASNAKFACHHNTIILTISTQLNVQCG